MTRLESGSGLNQANAVKNMLDEWDTCELRLGMCFDTTASNTAKLNGACILLEAICGLPAVTMCWEVILSNVAELNLAHLLVRKLIVLMH